MDNRDTGRHLRDFFRTGHRQRVHKGHIILGWGEAPTNIYYIEHGFIKAYSIGSDGDELIHEVHKSNEVFPLVWAYLRIPRNVFYEALGDSTIYWVPLIKFNNFALSSVDASHALARQTAEQLHMYSDRVDNLEYKKPAQRVAYRLLTLADRFGKRQGPRVIIDAPFTHQTIADSINIARETVSRELRQLQQDRIITFYSRRIVITNTEGLKKKVTPDLALQN